MAVHLRLALQGLVPRRREEGRREAPHDDAQQLPAQVPRAGLARLQAAPRGDDGEVVADLGIIEDGLYNRM